MLICESDSEGWCLDLVADIQDSSREGVTVVSDIVYISATGECFALYSCRFEFNITHHYATLSENVCFVGYIFISI